MPQCIVKGCPSGSKKCRSSGTKVHLFSVPKDPSVREKWQHAIKRTDVLLNSKHCVCEKHFVPKEVRWAKEMKDSFGYPVGISIRYAISRLESGAVLSIFEWTPGTQALGSETSEFSKEGSEIYPTVTPYSERSDVNEVPIPQFTELSDMLLVDEAVTMGGANDHPALPTFLQLYRILSTVGILLKPPKSGNCTVADSQKDSQILISVSELKTIYANPSKSGKTVQELKKRINQVIENDDWQFANFTDHDYSRPEVSDCIIYSFTADIMNRVLKHITCEDCRNALISPKFCDMPETTLSNRLHHNDSFVHPNVHLYNLVKKLENLFMQYRESTYAYENILNSGIGEKIFNFPCSSHGGHVLAAIVQCYMQNRMQRYCKHLNSQRRKISKEIKKNAKFMPM